MKCEVPLIAGPPGSLWWSRCGLWWLLWPSLFTETCLAGCNKQNKIWDNKNVSVFMKAQLFPRKRSHLEQIESTWLHLHFFEEKKKNPQLRTIQLSLWNSHPSKNDWKEGRKEGSKEKQRKKGGRKGSKAGAEPRMWTFDHLGNMPFKSWNPLFFFSYNKTNVSLRPNLLWKVCCFLASAPNSKLDQNEWAVFDSLIFLLSTNKSKDNEKCKPTCIRMFTAGLFIITKNWKQPKCSSGIEWINKSWHSYTMQY